MAGELIFYGATVERSADGSSGWEKVPGVKSVGLPEVAQDYQEVTSLDSPNGYREYIPGLKDAGEASLEQNYTREAMEQLEDDRGQLLHYRITFGSPDGGTTTGDVLTFQAIRSGSMTTDDAGAPMGIGNTLRLSGEPTWTAGS